MNGLELRTPVAVSLSERRVLDHVYSRQSGYISPRALASLVARGLVRESQGHLQITESGLRALQHSG